MAETICGVPLESFSKCPSVGEISDIVAHMDSKSQVDFLIMFIEALSERCANDRNRGVRIAELGEFLFQTAGGDGAVRFMQGVIDARNKAAR